MALVVTMLPVSDEFEGQEVTNEPLVVLLPADHALARKKSTDLASLQRLPFILFEKGFSLHRIIHASWPRKARNATEHGRSTNIARLLSRIKGRGRSISSLPWR